jgi:hypothetical protein
MTSPKKFEPGTLADVFEREESTHAQRIAHAEAMSARHLGNYNELKARGAMKTANQHLAKSQYWLDMANRLRGNGDGS